MMSRNDRADEMRVGVQMDFLYLEGTYLRAFCFDAASGFGHYCFCIVFRLVMMFSIVGVGDVCH